MLIDRRELLLLLPALAAAACGRGKGGATSGAALPTPGADGLVDGDARHLFRHIDASPRTLDPILVTEVPAQRIIDDLFEGLVRVAPTAENVRNFTAVRDAHAAAGGNRCRVTFQLTFLEANASKKGK